MAVVAAGNFERKAFLDDIEKYCGSWSGPAPTREMLSWQPQIIQREYRRKNTMQAHVGFMAPGPTLTDDSRYALSILTSIVGDSSGSTLYWDLVESGLAESASIDADEKDDTGYLSAMASTDPENLDEVATRMKKIISEPLNFSDEDLERARAKILTHIVLNGELPSGRFNSIGHDWLAQRHCESLSETMEQFRSVSRKDIERAVSRYPWSSWSEFRLVPE